MTLLPRPTINYELPAAKRQSDIHQGFEDAHWWRASGVKLAKAGSIVLLALFALTLASAYFGVGVSDSVSVIDSNVIYPTRTSVVAHTEDRR